MLPADVVVVVGAGVGAIVVPVVGAVVAPEVGAVVGAVVGTTMSVGGTGVAGGATGVDAPVVGPTVESVVPMVGDGGCVVESSVGPSAGSEDCAAPGVGWTVSPAASTGGAVGRWSGRVTASGSGISGVSRRGPSSRLLTMRMM